MKNYLVIDSYHGDSTYYVIKANDEDDAKAKHRTTYGESDYYYNLAGIEIRELKDDIEEICTLEG